MDNDSGRGSRPDEPPKLATVRHLHLDDVEGSRATATEEWYETERFAGQITGRTRSAAPIDRPPASWNETPVVLDWRHGQAVPPPTALERLWQSLDLRYRRRRRELTAGRQEPSARARGTRRAMPAGASEAAPPPLAPQADGPAADEVSTVRPNGPQIALRGAAGQAPERAKRLSAPLSDPRLRRWALVSVVVLSVAALSGVGIASQMDGIAAKPRESGLVAATSVPAAGLNTATETMIGVLGALERHVAKIKVEHRAVRADRRPRDETRARARASSRRRSSSTTETAGTAAPPVTPSTTRPYSSSSSSPAYTAQPATSEPTAAATSSAPSNSPGSTQPAGAGSSTPSDNTGSAQPAGPTGTGAGTVGNNCNPKCS